ncbi:MAG: acyl-CoA dehydratase activase [Phoenicibacter congonensis]|uniref:Acyl-CoA dehydratase activase n=1 Tax=Phoenicibacter congonensis TaxID=1944646 RepID=A0AA43RIG3_9ACTN|nr:acyl-CoA dehydratase activase [Phoenicibacter congonensis]
MYNIGIDIGSTSAKTAVLEDDKLAFTKVVPTGYNSVDAAERLKEELAGAGYTIEDANGVIATGYGRISVPFADKTITEITCHGRGAAFLFEGDMTVIDIGGQDTKAVQLKSGNVNKFLMNDKCSAGTGKFLEVMANRLGLTLSELCEIAKNGEETPISSMCTVFAESEVISLIGKGTPRENIARGVIDSVVTKVCSLVGRVGGTNFALTGGLCEEDFIVDCLAKALGGPVVTCPEARYAGAIGAALSVK